jgi:hypothetical protein
MMKKNCEEGCNLKESERTKGRNIQVEEAKKND